MKINKPKLLQSLLLLAFAASAEAAVTIYSNPFVYPNGTGASPHASSRLGNVGSWVGYNNNGTIHDGDVSRVFLADRPFPNHPADVYGVLVMDSNGSGPTKWAATTGLNIDSTQSDLTFRWIGGNDRDTTGVRLLVQVNNVWYASNSFYTTSSNTPNIGDFASATGSSTSFSYEFSSAAAGWSIVAFNPANQTADAGNRVQATSDLVGDITGIGFLKQNTGVVRIADFHITVPEPSSALLSAIGALGLLRRRRA